MFYLLYLDDMRLPMWSEASTLKFAKSYDEAVEIVRQFGFPTIVDLDHDLGEGKNGSDFVTWLIEFDMEHGVMPKNFEYYCHSSNTDGAKNIMSKFDSYMRSKEIDK